MINRERGRKIWIEIQIDNWIYLEDENHFSHGVISGSLVSTVIDLSLNRARVLQVWNVITRKP